jgi:hypothetical protein
MYPICKIKVGVNISSLDTMQVSMDKYNVKDIYTSMAHFTLKEIQLHFVLLALQTRTHENP